MAQFNRGQGSHSNQKAMAGGGHISRQKSTFHHEDYIEFSDRETVDVASDARVLFDAVRHGKTHLVRFIIEAAPFDIVNARDLHGKTPLMACIFTKEERSRNKIVKLLLGSGAEINLTDDFGRTALSNVCEKRCNDILRILVKEHNIDPDIPDNNGNTPLMYSAMAGNDIACDILIRHFRRLGLNIDQANVDGFTAILLAAKHGYVTCAQILLGQGKALIRHRDLKYGLSVEEWLEKNGFTLQDITPVKQDAKARSRFVRIANVAAICTGGKKAPIERDSSYKYIKNAVLERVDDKEGYDSDGTTVTSVNVPMRRNKMFSAAMNSDGGRRFKVYPTPPYQHQHVNQETQTLEISDPETVQTEKTYLKTEKNYKKKSKKGLRQHIQKNQTQRMSLPEIEVTQRDSKTVTRKNSLDVLPEVLIANLDMGDGRRRSIELRADSTRNRFYWKPYKDEKDEDVEEEEEEEDGDDEEDDHVIIDMDGRRSSSPSSSNDDGQVF